MNQYVAGYLWDGIYCYLVNNVGVFHLKYAVLKYVSAAIITISPTYLNKNVSSCLPTLLRLNLRAYDWSLVL